MLDVYIIINNHVFTVPLTANISQLPAHTAPLPLTPYTLKVLKLMLVYSSIAEYCLRSGVPWGSLKDQGQLLSVHA